MNDGDDDDGRVPTDDEKEKNIQVKVLTIKKHTYLVFFSPTQTKTKKKIETLIDEGWMTTHKQRRANDGGW